MILKASQRAGGMQLVDHLMNDMDNDHVTLYELSGFIADNLKGAMKEAFAISRGTKRCRQFLFSLSLNPPEYERVSTADFEDAIAKIEDSLRLTGQPRAIVFHEKEGRRHCHAVWLRVDVTRMRAINLPYFKLKLRDQSRELFLEHGWKLPKGLLNKDDRDPLNFSLQEWQQSKRLSVSPKTIKAKFQVCWRRSDDVNVFASALEREGFQLARGNQRGYVAVDRDGNAYSISRWIGIRAGTVRDKLGEPDNLPSVAKAHTELLRKTDGRLRRSMSAQAIGERIFTERLRNLRQQQREERNAMTVAHQRQRRDANRRNASLLPSGLKAMWSRITGRQNEIQQKIGNAELELTNTQLSEQEELIHRQLLARRMLQNCMRSLELEKERKREGHAAKRSEKKITSRAGNSSRPRTRTR